ncbi:MAG: aspartate-semialdehyde dehydrogenase [Candidatus Binatia bacterium]|nr:MAG: aspartate-semialdehyde dehydrogenase [Candidatus Binatia bacterium]
MKKSAWNVAVIGATGTVGREIVAVLAQRGFPFQRLRLFASSASAGQEVDEADVRVEELRSETDLAGLDLVFLACPQDVARSWRERAVAAGTFVIDLSAAGGERQDDILVVPEVNAGDLAKARERRAVASPDPAAIALSVVVHPLRQCASLRGILATVLDPLSLAGRRGVDLLEHEVHALLSGAEPDEPELFPQRVAFNVMPLAGGGRAPLRCAAPEDIVAAQVRAVLAAPTLPIGVTRVSVPVFYGMAVVAEVLLETPVEASRIEEQLRTAPGILLASATAAAFESLLPLPTPATLVGSDATHVACVHVRQEVPSVRLWIALDNTRKGSALNAVQIAELLARDYLA